jgi:hypothetical protein
MGEIQEIVGILKFEDNTLSAVSLASDMNKGNHTFFVELDTPKNSVEKWNLTVLGVEIDPELDICTDLNVAGLYEMNASIERATTTKCITISATNVIFDCRGYTLNGNRIADDGIYSDAGVPQYTNVIIRNCPNISDWDARGVLVEDSRNVTVDNISLYHNLDEGIRMDTSDYSKINNTLVTGNTNGGAIYFFNTEANIVENTQVYDANLDIVWYSTSNFDCNGHNFTNVTDDLGRYHQFFYEDNTIVRDANVYEQNISSMIFCETDNSAIVNSSFNASFNRVGNGVLLSRATTNFTADNLTIYGFLRGYSSSAGPASGSNFLNNSNISNCGTAFFGNYAGTSIDNTRMTGNNLAFRCAYARSDLINSVIDNNVENTDIVASCDRAQIHNNSITGGTNYGYRIRDIGTNDPDYVYAYNNIFNNTDATNEDVIGDATILNPNYMYKFEHECINAYDDSNPICCGNFYNYIPTYSDTNSLNCTDANTDGFCDDFINFTLGAGSELLDHCPLSDEFAGVNNPEIDFVAPTPDDSDSTSNTSVEINITVKEAILMDDFTYNWNGTNYTIYNDSLMMMVNLDEYHFVGENTETVRDFSRNGLKGEGVGTIWNASAGKFDGAWEFDGNGDRIDFDTTLFDNVFNEFSITTWAEVRGNNTPGNIPDQQAIVYKCRTTTQVAFSIVYIESRESIRIELRDSSGGTPKTATSRAGSVPLNQLTHMGYVWNGTVLKVYIDGELHNSTAVTVTSWGVSDISLGRATCLTGTASDRYFNGSIDSVRIWNRTLSEEELNLSYFSNFRKDGLHTWSFYTNQTDFELGDGLEDGDYTYFASTENFQDDTNQTETRTITISSVAVADIPFNVTIIDPVNNTYNDTTNTIDFQYNASGSNIDNCSLIINGAINTTDTSITEEEVNEFQTTLNNGDYNWSVNCTNNTRRYLYLWWFRRLGY